VLKYIKGEAWDTNYPTAAGKERNAEYKTKQCGKYPMAANGEGSYGYAIFTIQEVWTRSSL